MASYGPGGGGGGAAQSYYQPEPPMQSYQQYQQQPPPPQQQQQQCKAPPPQGPPPQYSYTPPQGHQGEKYTFDQAFKIDKPKYNDLWAGILFILFFLGFAAVSGVAIHGYASSRGFTGGSIYDGVDDLALSTNTIILFAFCLAVSVVLGYGYVMLARFFPKQFIWVTGILNILWAFGTAIYMLYNRYWSGGIVFLVFGVIIAFFFWSWRRRIPFSALLLKTSVKVANRYGHVFLVSFLGGLLAIGFAAWYAVTLVAIYVQWQPDGSGGGCQAGEGSCSEARVIGLVVYVTFCMYWISEWLKNTIHTTISGVYGSWYFCSQNFPGNATRGALRRSLTYSFGSICLGSLIVAIIQFLRQACRVAMQEEGSSGNPIGFALFCVANCCLGLLEWAVEFLNRYAFSHIALYGKAYIAAAKDTWKMIKDRGIDALINECLIGPVLSFGALFVGYACALLAFLYLLFTDPAYNRDGSYTALIVAFAFLIGLQITNIFTTPLSSGIDTIFVAAAWDPEVMMRDHSELYHEMVKVYPHVQQAIHA